MSLTNLTNKERKNEKKSIGIEDVLSSKGRVKIMQVLAKHNELNISEIARRSQLNHSTAISHLRFLEKAGLVQKKIFGRIRIYRFRLENLRAKGIKSLFDLWDETLVANP